MRNRNPFSPALAVLVMAGLHASGQDHIGSGVFTVAESPVVITDSLPGVWAESATPLIWEAGDPVILAEAEIPGLFQEVEIIRQKTMAPEPRIYLGVALAPVSEALRSHLKLRKNSGVLVKHVIEGSPAAMAGILQYDVLTHLDDQLLLNQEQLVSLLATYNEGDNVSVHLFREGARKTLEVSLQEKSLPPIQSGSEKIITQTPQFHDGLSAEKMKMDFQFDPSTPMKDVIEALEAIGNDTDVASVFVNPTGPGDKNVQANAKVRIQTAEGLSTTLSMLNGVRHITILDKDQNVLFEGPFDAETDLSSKVPSEYHRALKTIQNHNKEFFQRGTNAESMLKSLFQKKKSSDQKSSLSGGHSTSSSSSSNSRSIQVNDGERTISFSSKDGVDSLKVTKKEDGKDVVLYDGPANNAALGKIPFPHKPVVRKFLQDNGIISPSSK